MPCLPCHTHRLYAKEVEPVADNEESRRHCFNTAQMAYENLKASGVIAALASAASGEGAVTASTPTASHTQSRSVRRGASSTALGGSGRHAQSPSPMMLYALGHPSVPEGEAVMGHHVDTHWPVDDATPLTFQYYAGE